MKIHFNQRLIAVMGILLTLIPTVGSAQIADQKSFAEDGNEFALALYKQLQQQPGNLFFSPYSVRMALAMTYAGARGETATQMRKALRFPSQGDSLHAAASAIMNRLNTAAGGVTVANSLWGQDGAPLQKEFVDLVDRYYSGAMNRVDFRHAAEPARVAINRWVEDKTKQKIRDLIAPGGVTTDTRLVLVNAIHFKGTWEDKFGKTATKEAPFYLENGGVAQAALMHQKARIRHMQTADFQAVELGYLGSDLSMLVLLPATKNGLSPLQDRLTVRLLRDCVAQLGTREVDLFLPGFKITWGTQAIEKQLRALGMPLAFDPKADFSGIDGHKPPEENALFISAVLHKAFVDVNEEGTEAAAATAVLMGLGSAAPIKQPVPVFRADHPFLFAIRDTRSGAILFLGRVADPTLQ